MSRPIYEGEADREAELVVMNHLALKGFSALPSPTYSCIDMVIFKGHEWLGFGEVRRRKMKFKQYPDVFMSAAKVKKIAELQSMVSLPTWFFLALDDGLWSMKMPSINDRLNIKEGGRNQMRDKWDREPMAHFEWGCFKNVG